MAGDLSAVRALTFDVFGTVVDWRGSIIREGRRLGRANGSGLGRCFVTRSVSEDGRRSTQPLADASGYDVGPSLTLRVTMWVPR